MTPFLAVLRVVKVLPQEQVTSVTTYSGWMPCFMCWVPSAGRRVARGREPEPGCDGAGWRGPRRPSSLPGWHLADQTGQRRGPGRYSDPPEPPQENHRPTGPRADDWPAHCVGT